MAEDRAVVVGASMAGLLAARVLADRFGEVVLVEKDELPDAVQPRKGVPQGRHVHALLPSGEQVLNDMFPGFSDELIWEGAVRIRPDGGVSWWQDGGYRIGSDGPPFLFSSRPFLEGQVRRRVAARPNVSFLSGTADSLVVEEGSVRGLRVRTGEDTTTLDTSLVVDASGRSGQLNRWLTEAGSPTPRVDQVHVDIQYTTQILTRTAASGPKPMARFVIDLDTMSGGAAFPVEDDRWVLTLAGYHGLRAEPDEKSFLAFAEGLPADDLAAIIRAEQPLAPITTHRFPCSQWRRYDKLPRHLPGVLAIGDSVCSFNPLYGQGMSSAALQSEALAQALDRSGGATAELPAAFYRRAAKVISNPWSIAVGGDFVSPKTTGPKPPLVDLINRYIRQMSLAAQVDPVVSAQFQRVANLLAPPPTLMKPGVALRVWKGARQVKASRAGRPAPAPSAPVGATD